MDRAEADGGGSLAKMTLLSDAVTAEYTSSYLQSFLPVLHAVNQSDISSVSERYTAIKLAADASLAATASGATWSQALGEQLREAVASRLQDGSSERDDEAMTGTLQEAGARSTASVAAAPILERAPDREAAEAAVAGILSGNSAGRRGRLNVAGRKRAWLRLAALGEGRVNWWTRLGDSGTPAGGRLGVLRRLSLKIRKKRVARAPRRELLTAARRRRVKTLAKRSKKVAPLRPVPVETDQRLEGSILALQKLVPGGDRMNEEALLDETVDFVSFLKLQAHALQMVAAAVDQQLCAGVP